MADPERPVNMPAQLKAVDWGSLDLPALQEPIWDNLQETLPRILQKEFPRRDILKAGFIGLVALTSGEKAIELGLKQLERVELARWNQCAISNQEFYDRHRIAISNIIPATTFIPGGSLQEMHTSDGQNTLREDQLLLERIVKDLGFRRVRVGLRLKNVVDSDGNVTLEYYRWLLDYLADHQVEMTINLGMKNAGSPEVFLPDSEARALGRTPEGAKITLDNDLAKKSLEWSNRLCFALRDYSQFITGVQPNNEPYAKFGLKNLIMGSDFVVALAAVGTDHFPDAEILINDNIWNFPARGRAIDTLMQLKAGGNDNLVFGINHYPFVPQLCNFELFGQQLPPALKRLDPVLIAGLPWFSLTADINRAITSGIQLRFTEIQAEPYPYATGWDDKEPGDSATAYRHAIRGAITLAPDIEKATLPKKVEFSIWTARPLASALVYPRELTTDKKEMIEFTQMLTQQAA